MNKPRREGPVGQISSLLFAMRDDFPGTELDQTAWEVVQLGAGQNISLTGGELNLAAGVTPNSETIIRSLFYFTVPFRVWFIGRLSQRIANQEFYLEAVNAAGDMLAQWMFDGTTATQGKYGVANAGIPLVSAPVTITSTVADTIYEMQLFPDENWFSQRGADSTGSKSYSFVRHKNIPDPNHDYYLQIRIKNLATAPASSTTLTLGAVAAQDINELTAEITGGQGDSAGAKGVAVCPASALVAGTALIGAVNVAAATTTTNALNLYKLLAGASTNAAVVKSTAGRVYGWSFANLSAAWRFVKIYNKSTAPVVGTDVPVFTIAVPPGGLAEIEYGIGTYSATGIGIATTTGWADADTGAVAAGDIVGYLHYA